MVEKTKSYYLGKQSLNCYKPYLEKLWNKEVTTVWGCQKHKIYWNSSSAHLHLSNHTLEMLLKLFNEDHTMQLRF